MRTLLVATTNPDKLGEVMPLLADLGYELKTLADVPAVAEPEETGLTFAENARLKARHYARATGLLTVAEDSGLEIDVLDRAPGVESARFGGPRATYPERFALIYERLRARGATTSPARFVCAIALVRPGTSSQGDGGDLLCETTGTLEGVIAPEPRGTGGFGYDPIFFYPPFGTTLAESADRKSTISHRGAAVRKLHSFFTAHPPK